MTASGKEKNPECDQQKHRQRDKRNHIARLHPDCVRTDHKFRLLPLDPVSPDQKAMRIDTVGRTGHERAVIFVRIDRKIFQLIGQDNPNLIHLVVSVRFST